VSNIIPVLIVIEHELLAVFVDRIIGEVHVHVRQISAGRAFVFFGCKPSQSFLRDKSTKRTHTCHQNVDSKVKLEAPNQQGLVKVSLGDEVLVHVVHPVVVSS
jgi:hypothetical protein